MTGVGPLDVVGDARARGLAQGRAGADDIAAHRAALLASFARAGIAEPEDYVGRMLRETRFDEAIERHMPHLMREVEGIADGAGLPHAAVYALQLLDEEWAYRGRVYAPRPIQKCSSFAIHDPAAQETWIGQNMDLGPYTDGFQLIARHAPDGDRPGALVLTTAGVLALLGVNDRGVGVCVNSLPQLPNAAEGVPVAFMIRHLLEATSAAEAADWCRSLPHATNQHYLIADPSRIISLECSAAGITEYIAPDRDRVLHTNHPLAGGASRYPRDEPNSVARLRSLEGRLASGANTAEALRDALCAFDDPANPVCRLATDDGVISFTTGSMISALRPAPAMIESVVSLGPPSERGYVAHWLDRAAVPA